MLLLLRVTGPFWWLFIILIVISLTSMSEHLFLHWQAIPFLWTIKSLTGPFFYWVIDLHIKKLGFCHIHCKYLFPTHCCLLNIMVSFSHTDLILYVVNIKYFEYLKDMSCLERYYFKIKFPILSVLLYRFFKKDIVLLEKL